MKKLFLIITLLLFATGNVVGQNPNNHWQLGNSDVNFSTNPPTVTTAGNVNQYGNASISDDNGNLLFYTDGNQVWNKNHNIIPQTNSNSFSFNADIDSFQSVVIVPQPNSSKYFIVRAFQDQTLSLPVGNLIHFYQYAIIDFTVNPLGEFINLTNSSQNPTYWSNIPGYTATYSYGKGCPLTVTKMSNDTGYWIINEFEGKITSFSLTDNGLSSLIESFADDLGGYKKAIYKFTPDNLKMGVYASNVSGVNSIGKFYMFDFDSSTGLFSNQTRINFLNSDNLVSASTFAFSNDSQKVYFAGAYELQVKELANPSLALQSVATMPLSTPQTNYKPYRWNLQTDKNGEILLVGNGLDYVKKILNQNSFSTSSLSPVIFNLNNTFGLSNSSNIANLPQLIPVLTPPCPNTLVISTNVASGLDKKQASVSIEATNVINIGAGAIYHAPTVILKPSFNAKAGSAVHLYTVGCTNTFLARPFNVETSNDNFSESNKYFQEKANIISVQPNPNNGIFKISLNEVSEGTIEISDLYGFNIYKSEFKNQTDFEMNLQNRPKGIYIVKVFSREQVFTSKIIKN